MAGQIARQSFWASVVNYSGSLVGLFTTFYLFPLVYTESENGVIGLFIEMGALLAGVAQLGTGYSIWRFFPRFKNDKGHNGAGFWILLIPFIGFLITAVALLFFKGAIMHYLGKNAVQFEPYYYWLLPFIFFFVFNNVFEIFSSSIGNIIFASFLRENVVRIFLGLIGFLYYVHYLPFERTVQLVPLVYFLMAILNFTYILKNTQISFRPDIHFLKTQSNLKRDFSKYTAYLFLTYLANMFIQRMDFVMISSMNGFSDTGIYRIAVSMAVLIEIPTRSILQISNPKLSEAMHKGDTEEMSRLYQKTSLNQFILGAIVLLLLWVNIDLFYALMPNGEKYAPGKLAVLFLGIGKLFILLQGNSSAILIFSPKYYLSLVVNLSSLIVGILLNSWAIPIWGIEGAALATAGTWAASSAVTVLLIKVQYRLIPFTPKLLMVVVLFLAMFTLNFFWKISASADLMGLLLYTFKTVIIFTAIIVIIYRFRLSDDIRSMIEKLVSRFTK